MNKESYDQFNGVIKDKIAELKFDYEKLKSVDRLLGKDTTEQAKQKIQDTIIVLRDVQSTIIDQRAIELGMVVQNATQSNN